MVHPDKPFAAPLETLIGGSPANVSAAVPSSAARMIGAVLRIANEPGWPAIVTASATVALALVATVQILAGKAQARAQADAVKRQWQPRVFVHGWSAPYDNGNADPEEMAVPYYLSNEGTGPAFNVEHGVEVGGERYTVGGGHLYRMLQAGEEVPPMRDAIGLPVSLSPIVVHVRHDGRDSAAIAPHLVYFARFENLMGERFEVRNFPDPTRPAEFRALPA